jgi:hypothetical protein
VRVEHAILQLVDIEDRRDQTERLAEQGLDIAEVRTRLRGGLAELFAQEADVPDRGGEWAAQIVHDQRGKEASLFAELARAVSVRALSVLADRGAISASASVGPR